MYLGREGNEFLLMAEAVNDEKYILKCQYAIGIMEAKLMVISEQLENQSGREVVRGVTDRIKSPESICSKLKRKGLDCNFNTAVLRLNDLVGVRVVCLFLDDVYNVAQLIKMQQDVTVIKEKDYIKNPKSNGYMSLHLIIEIPVYFEEEYEKKRMEIQIRTVAMDFWSVLDYQLFYKKALLGADKVARELKEYAEIIAGVDKKMMRLRNQIENI